MNRYAICNEMFQDWEQERVFAFAAETGYAGVEIAPFTLAPTADAVTAKQREDLRKAAEREGVQIIGLHWLLAKTEGLHLTTADADTRKRTAEYVQALARLCADLGGSLMVFGSPQQRSLETGTNYDAAWARAVEVVRECIPVLEETGVTLCMEPLATAETDFINTASAGSNFCDEIDHPRVKLHLDVKAMSDEGYPIDEIIVANSRHLHHFHANDPNKLGPGMGEVDFVPIRKALDEVGYRDWLSVEVFDLTPGPETIARESIRYLREMFE